MQIFRLAKNNKRTGADKAWYRKTRHDSISIIGAQF